MTAAAIDQLRLDVGAAVIIEQIAPEEIAHYVVSTPELARARAVLVEAYRRLTDYITPLRLLPEIAPAIDALERWNAPGPYLEARQP